MEAVKANLQCGTQTNLKVVKVVELKRFMPNTLADTVLKRKQFAQRPLLNLNNESSYDHPEDGDIKNLGDPVKVDTNLNTTDINVSKHVEENLCRTKLTDNQKSEVKFKSCSHTPEELSRLSVHCHETLVKVGDTFDSREAFRQYLYDNAKTWLYYYICRNSKKNFMVYNCICMPYTLKPRAIVIRRQKKRTTSCPCKIRLTVDENTKKVLVYYVCNHHDHYLTKAAFYDFPHAKYLPREVKDVFLDLAYLGLDIGLIQKYINSLVGVTIKRKDIWSYAYKFKRKIMQRNLTADRKKHIEDLITTIRNTYDDKAGHTLERNLDDVCEIVTATNPKKSERSKRQNVKDKKRACLDIIPDIDVNVNINSNDSGESILDEVFDPNHIELRNDDVIVQYVNEAGILCDQNGTPVTSSSAIMQFITNQEHVMTEGNGADDEFPEEGTAFDELVENVDDDMYPLDWELQESKPIEEAGEAHNVPYVETNDDQVATDADITVEATLQTIECELSYRQGSNIARLSVEMCNSDKRLPPTPVLSPGLYAEMDIFKKYYFVDHRYIKFEDENSKHQKRIVKEEKRKNRRGRTDVADAASVEEYVKAPKFACYPTPLRVCCGHENLTLLSDTDVILPGAKFLTQDVFLAYINERANRWYFYYSLIESGKYPEYYVYKCVFGKHRVSKNAYRAKGLRKRAKLTTQCPCQIRLRRLESQPMYLTVLYSCNHHDHALDAQAFKAQPHSRRLPEHLKEEVKDLLAVGATFHVLRQYVLSETGLRIYGKYFHNVKAKMRRSGECRKLTEERVVALTKKIEDLEDMYGCTSKDDPLFETSQCQAMKRRLSALKIMMEDDTQVGMDEAATQGIQSEEYYRVANIDNIAQEICIVQADSLPMHPVRKHSRLETRLQNISSHEETLLNVKKLQASARCDNLRNTYEDLAKRQQATGVEQV